jgi:hypothetical protein
MITYIVASFLVFIMILTNLLFSESDEASNQGRKFSE